MLMSSEQGSFLVQILDRQHESWQGVITWLADGKKKTFRSLLEFITIVEGEMSTGRCEKEITRPVLSEETIPARALKQKSEKMTPACELKQKSDEMTPVHSLRQKKEGTANSRQPLCEAPAPAMLRLLG